MKKRLSGILEHAGLDEFVYYMKSAAKYMGYAGYSLENVDFDFVNSKMASINSKMEQLKMLAAEVSNEIDSLPVELEKAIEEREE